MSAHSQAFQREIDDYTVEVLTYRPDATSRWMIEVSVTRDGKHAFPVWRDADHSWSTKDEAEAAGFRAGARIVRGR